MSNTEKHEEIVVKMMGHWLARLTQRKSYTDQYTHYFGVTAKSRLPLAGFGVLAYRNPRKDD